MAEIHITHAARELIEIYSEAAGTDPNKAERIVHQSAKNLLSSKYMARSKWFQNAPAHSFMAAVFVPKQEPSFTAFFHLILGDPATVVAPEEYPLDDDYFAKRILTEVVVDSPGNWPDNPKE